MSLRSMGKSGKPWDKLTAFCSMACFDITANMEVPVDGNFVKILPVNCGMMM